MPDVSRTHLVLIPSYNTGAPVSTRFAPHARNGTRCGWWSTAAPTARASGCSAMAAADPGLRVIVLPHNQGKGAAVLHGLRAARRPATPTR